jgi:3-oxoadipate enol-lactonase
MNFIEANGVSLRYAAEGAGKPIVLIHEMGGTMESWEFVASLLSKKRRVVRYDTRGAGFSEKIRGGALAIDTMTADLIGLLDGLGIKEKVSLAGMAVGGSIALHTAFRHPDRIAAAIVTSPATSIPFSSRAETLERVEKFEREGVRVAFGGTAANGYPEEMRTDAARFAAWRARWLANDPASFGAIYRMLVAMDLSGELPQIKCPVLVVAGEFDRGRPPARVEPVAKAIPGAEFKVLPVGHYAGLQKPELIAQEIAAFLEKAGA